MPDNNIPPGSVIVTPEQMWVVMQETRDSVRKLETLLNPSLAEIHQDHRELDERENIHHEAHERAIRDLQQATWSSRWVTALVTATGTAAVGGLVLWVLGSGHIS